MYGTKMNKGLFVRGAFRLFVKGAHNGNLGGCEASAGEPLPRGMLGLAH